MKYSFFYSNLYLKIYWNNLFLFFKFIFNINILKNIKKLKQIFFYFFKNIFKTQK
jgi:hypothetical protein